MKHLYFAEDRLRHHRAGADAGDSVYFAHQLYLGARADLLGSMRFSRNGRRLLAIPELAEDVALCLQTDRHDLVTVLGPAGELRPAPGR